MRGSEEISKNPIVVSKYPRLALFASGTGTNVAAIIAAVKSGRLQAKIVAIVCDEYQAPVIVRAQQAKCPLLVLNPKDTLSRQGWEEQLVAFLKNQQVDWIALAGFMRIIGQPLLEAFPHHIVNIHPALLPAFPGRTGIEDAYRAKVAKTGVTIHYVDSGIDTGEIIAQESLEIDPKWTLADLAQRIHQIEHRLYPTVLNQLFIQEKITERKE
ncbi:MAG: phosphoribosylglycinamide formyltransferase [Aerococcus sp.]|nr:phosphoribosylglycinamide formyltransferase [Aerococcus sp.]